MARDTLHGTGAIGVAVAALCLLAPTPAAAAGAWDWATGPALEDREGGHKDWSVAIMPALWLASTDGRMGFPPAGNIPVSSTYTSLSSNLDAGFAGFVDIRWRRWHLISDNSWVRLKGSATPTTPVAAFGNIESNLAFGTVGIAYELPLAIPVAWDVYLAARWWHTNDELTLRGGPLNGRRSELTENWGDVIFGTRVRYAITKHWKLSAVGDVGAGAADIDWQVYGGLTYMFNRHVGLTGGYRILGVDYRQGNGFDLDIKQQGLLLGLNLAF